MLKWLNDLLVDKDKELYWTVTVFPENGWKQPRVFERIIRYKIIPSPYTPRKSYVSFDFEQGHITVLFDRMNYRKFEIHTNRGNFVVSHGNSGLAYEGRLLSILKIDKPTKPC